MGEFRIKAEKETVNKMIVLYCRKNHFTKNELCSDCKEILEYALLKYDKCPLKMNKPVCSNCKIHCYEKSKRDKIKQIMRFSGPRMIWKHPLLTIFYLFNKITVKSVK